MSTSCASESWACSAVAWSPSVACAVCSVVCRSPITPASALSAVIAPPRLVCVSCTSASKPASLTCELLSEPMVASARMMSRDVGAGGGAAGGGDVGVGAGEDRRSARSAPGRSRPRCGTRQAPRRAATAWRRTGDVPAALELAVASVAAIVAAAPLVAECCDRGLDLGEESGAGDAVGIGHRRVADCPGRRRRSCCRWSYRAAPPPAAAPSARRPRRCPLPRGRGR